MFRHGSKVPIVAAAALAVLTGCARGEAVAPDGAAAHVASAPTDAAALQDHARGMAPGVAHAETLAAHFDLSPAEEARIRALLDSLHTEMVLAQQEGPDALATAARSGHARLEAALPEDARPMFRQMHERLRHGEMGEHPDGHVHPGAEDRPPHDATHGGGPASHPGMHRMMPEGGHGTGRHGGA